MSFYRVKISWVIGLAATVSLAACSDDGDQPKQLDQGTTDDVSVTVDLPPQPDLGVLPDLGQQTKCYSEWRDAISPQSSVTTGTVTTTQSSGINTTVLDASAGGSSSAAKMQPFVYISLKDGKRVDIDDYTAKTDTTWDIAFRRTVILINSGDSGAGQAAIAVISGTDLSQVTAVPAASSFKPDDYLDDNCTLVTDPINLPKTAINGGSGGTWYDMNTGTMVLSPRPEIYVIKRANGTDHVKLQITDYKTGGTSGIFTVKWSELK